MELPATFGADDVRDEKLKLLRSVRPISPEDAVHAQYAGYRQEQGVAPGSRTPTYAALRLHIDNWRWQGVPFYIRAGKRLARRTTEVSVHFQQIPFCLFGREDVCQLIEPNVLTLRIQPDEGIALKIASKVPGDDLRVGSVTMDFSYAGAFGSEPGEAYEKLLLDAMRGDATLFARRDGDEQAWSLLAPVLEGWDASKPAALRVRAGRQRPDRRGRAAAPRRPALAPAGRKAVKAELIVVPDARALARRAAERIVELTRAAVKAQGACSVALAGGSTPRATYEVLATSALAAALPWGAISWYFGDERAVPPDHPESNYGAARETLFAHRPELLERVHRMPADASDLETAARAYGAALPDPLDLVLLGIGEDGHTASLFPGLPSLAERAARVVVVTGPKPPNPRLSITAPVIRAGARGAGARERSGEGRRRREGARGAARPGGRARAARARRALDRRPRRRARARVSWTSLKSPTSLSSCRSRTRSTSTHSPRKTFPPSSSRTSKPPAPRASRRSASSTAGARECRRSACDRCWGGASTSSASRRRLPSVAASGRPS